MHHPRQVEAEEAPPYRHPGPRGADTGAGKERSRERKCSEYLEGQEN